MKKTLILGVAVAAATALSAQQPGAARAAPPSPMPEVGSMAPDFTFAPVTMAGIGQPTKLSSLKGQTVVVWFFPKARTRG